MMRRRRLAGEGHGRRGGEDAGEADHAAYDGDCRPAHDAIGAITDRNLRARVQLHQSSPGDGDGCGDGLGRGEGLGRGVAGGLDPLLFPPDPASELLPEGFVAGL